MKISLVGVQGFLDHATLCWHQRERYRRACTCTWSSWRKSAECPTDLLIAEKMQTLQKWFKPCRLTQTTWKPKRPKYIAFLRVEVYCICLYIVVVELLKFVGVYAGSNVITAAGCAVVQSSKSSVNGRLFVSFKFFCSTTWVSMGKDPPGTFIWKDDPQSTMEHGE